MELYLFSLSSVVILHTSFFWLEPEPPDLYTIQYTFPLSLTHSPDNCLKYFPRAMDIFQENIPEYAPKEHSRTSFLDSRHFTQNLRWAIFKDTFSYRLPWPFSSVIYCTVHWTLCVDTFLGQYILHFSPWIPRTFLLGTSRTSLLGTMSPGHFYWGQCLSASFPGHFLRLFSRTNFLDTFRELFTLAKTTLQANLKSTIKCTRF